MNLGDWFINHFNFLYSNLYIFCIYNIFCQKNNEYAIKVEKETLQIGKQFKQEKK